MKRPGVIILVLLVIFAFAISYYGYQKVTAEEEQVVEKKELPDLRVTRVKTDMGKVTAKVYNGNDTPHVLEDVKVAVYLSNDDGKTFKEIKRMTIRKLQGGGYTRAASISHPISAFDVRKPIKVVVDPDGEIEEHKVKNNYSVINLQKTKDAGSMTYGKLDLK